MMGYRFIELSADKLFAQDVDEIYNLWHFAALDIPCREVRDHFSQKINEKAHKVKNDSSEALEIFREAYATL